MDGGGEVMKLILMLWRRNDVQVIKMCVCVCVCVCVCTNNN